MTHLKASKPGFAFRSSGHALDREGGTRPAQMLVKGHQPRMDAPEEGKHGKQLEQIEKMQTK